MNGITFTKAYATSDGKTFSELAEAQTHELKLLLCPDGKPTVIDDGMVEAMLRHSAAIINILSTTASSRPKGRKANGATRKPKTKPTEETKP